MKGSRINLLFLIYFSVVSIAYGTENTQIKCGQNISTLPQLEIEFIDKTFTIDWYKAPIQSVHFGNVKPVTASYLFLSSKFYGKAYTIVGKDNISDVLRYFRNELKEIYKDDVESNPFAYPTNKKHFWLFIHPEKVITVKRYTVHTAQIEVLCRDRWEKLDYQNVTEIK